MPDHVADITIIGGGIVGLAVADALRRRLPDRSLILIEKESDIAIHQTGRNSGVIHSGLYYRPGSLKARNCVRGREMLYRFCEREEIPHERCGKIVVATNGREVKTLRELEERGRRNGLKDIKRLCASEMRDYEPHVAGTSGLYTQETGIVDFKQVARALLRRVQKTGGNLLLNTQLKRAERHQSESVLETNRGAIQTRLVINCAGLHSDRVAKMFGLHPRVQIVPFRGEYYDLKPKAYHLVRNLVYPVPDPRFPFLGVHFTRMIGGGIEAGPNAVLAFKREGYTHRDVSLVDLSAMATGPGLWRLISRHWMMGLGEFYRSLSKPAFVRALQRLVPEIEADDLERGSSGVRAQALLDDGRLHDDFYLVERAGMIHVLNAPSPAATSSLSIGKLIARRAARHFQ